MSYQKPRTIDEQIRLLRSRGMAFGNEEEAKQCFGAHQLFPPKIVNAKDVYSGSSSSAKVPPQKSVVAPQSAVVPPQRSKVPPQKSVVAPQRAAEPQF